ncbi:hypothetical protein BG015_007486 [Linnemannia schmuckeri]|uniref:Major facilitator superfamily (MFS) profile domain-containing protein n=1 Tax=Linnemannia schmuckeri TaxID=64567 RepID=A0A9P5RYS9_9FUNG|nr:hypothetical protein BG015_007486 [Linnemannia schmuckeri]
MESKQHDININTVPAAAGEPETAITSALPQQTIVISTEPLPRTDTSISEQTQHASPTTITHKSLNNNDNDDDHCSPSATTNPVNAQEPPFKQYQRQQERQSWTAAFLNSLKEGGTKGWLAVLGSFLIHCFVFAPTEFIFGIFEHHYQIVFPGASASSIAFVGTTGSGITYLTGFLSGVVADRFGYRPTAFVGTVIMAVSLVLASFSTALWHLYACHGVLFGFGASFAYTPAIAVPSQYFSLNRGLVIGLAVSGTGMGGFVLAPMTQALIDKLGVFWTLRVIALLTFVICGLASLLIKEKKDDLLLQQQLAATIAHQEEQTLGGSSTDYGETTVCEKDPEQPIEHKEGDQEPSAKKKPSFFQSLHVLKDPQFMSLTLANVTVSIGYLVPLYYMQTYAVFIGLTPEQGALILGLANGSGFAGRVLLGLIADRVSNTKTLLFSAWATAFSVMVLWFIAKSFGTLLLMGITFNVFAGCYISLVPVAVAESFGTQTIASMIGLMYAVGGIAIWVGSPLAGFILDSTLPNLSYTPVIWTAGVSVLLAALFVTSWAIFHWRAIRTPVAGRLQTIEIL